MLTHNGDEPVNELARLREDETITQLIVQGAKVTVDETMPDEAVLMVDLSNCGRYLSTSIPILQGLTKSVKLKLSNSRVTNGTLQMLRFTSEPPSLHLKSQDLSHSHVTDAGLNELAGLQQLQSLDLTHTDVTDEGVKRLQKALPNCKIER